MRPRGYTVLLAILVACGEVESPKTLSEDAKVETYEALVADQEAPRHASDGGGRAWLEPSPTEPIAAGTRHRFEVVFEAGPLGVAEGGVVFFQPSPFWGWDPPQTESPELPGYTEVSTDASGVSLDVSTPGRDLLAAHVGGRGLSPGERLRIVYGAGPRGARVDRYAESRSPLFVAVDGDGDGVRGLLDEVPEVDVVPGPPARLLVTLPTTAAPGESVRVALAVVDALGNAGGSFDEPIDLSAPAVLALPERATLSERGTLSLTTSAAEPGVYRVRASAGPLVAESNPMVVREGVPRIVWGDLHGHSQLSDGTGTPDDYFWYARDVAALDVVSLTDHDHWGMRFLDRSPETWDAIQAVAGHYDEPGRFVTVRGYEWTNWLHGHRHVLYFGEGGDVLSSLDPNYDDPRKLWSALKGRSALTVAHHSAGGPISTNWSFVPAPDLEPVTEIVSVHGSSEAPDAPASIYAGVQGNYVRDALDRGLEFGFIGSGDGHDGHPGLAHLGAPSGGLAAIFTESLTREGVLDALRSRRVYATNGPRIWLRVWLEEGLRFAVAGTSEIERADIIRKGEPIRSLSGEGRREWSETVPVAPLGPGDYVYVRIVQRDGGAAWSSPFFGR